eukprot:GAHX01003028.1.p1 GENE.GAHX01003028.1~~GAHX01003028.1.p1  ORF type:complete len:75 (-),score=3.15 GAHX01003028.1:47-271(-)
MTIMYLSLQQRIMNNTIDKSTKSTNRSLKLVSEVVKSSNLCTEVLINFITTKFVIPLIKQVYIIHANVTIIEYK